MATERDKNFIAQAIHHLMNADIHQLQGIKFLRAFVEGNTQLIDNELSKLGFDIPNEMQRKDIGRICSKMQRQWLDSRSTSSAHNNEINCECHLCLLDKLKEYAMHNTLKQTRNV